MSEQFTVAALRSELELTLAEMGERIGLSKSQMHEVEASGRASLRVALEIEKLSGGRINAGELNGDVALARAGQEDWSGHGAACATAHAAPSPGKIEDNSHLARAASGAGGDAGPAAACPPLAGPAERAA